MSMGTKAILYSCSAWALTEMDPKQYQSQSQTHDYGCLFAPQSTIRHSPFIQFLKRSRL